MERRLQEVKAVLNESEVVFNMDWLARSKAEDALECMSTYISMPYSVDDKGICTFKITKEALEDITNMINEH